MFEPNDTSADTRPPRYQITVLRFSFDLDVA
jgi:hypothetical protein